MIDKEMHITELKSSQISTLLTIQNSRISKLGD